MTDYSIFFIIAVVATGVGALLFLLSLFGLGEHDLDFDADSGGADVGLLSIKSGIGFFLGFGWGGVLAQGLDWGMAASLAAAFFIDQLVVVTVEAVYDRVVEGGRWVVKKVGKMEVIQKRKP